jgi:hypothetical protein
MKYTTPPTANPLAPLPSEGFRFRLVHLLYLVTLIASSLATFGLSGLVSATPIAAFWACIFLSKNRPLALIYACLGIIFLLFCGGGFFLPAVQNAREASRRMSCGNNIKQLALAMHNYHDEHGVFPPAIIADENGRPLHSWRVLLLPYLECQSLYAEYDMDEPWNGPNNRKLSSAIPYTYKCPSRDHRHGQFYTSYVAVTGDSTMWRGKQQTSLSDITDGAGRTVMIVEHHASGVHWMEPRDVPFEPLVQQFGHNDDVWSGPHRHESFFYEYPAGRNVAFSDGSVRFLRNALEANTWAAMLTTAGGETWNENQLYGNPYPAQRLRLGNCIRFGIWFLVVVMPFPWIWFRPNRL